MLSFTKLPQITQDHLTEVLGKEAKDLTEIEVRYLKALQGYLTKDQKDSFSEVLSGKIAGQPEPKVEVGEVVTDEKKIINPNDYKLDVLRQMAKDVNLEFTEEMTKREIADMLNAR
jgi:hypothetical protein